MTPEDQLALRGILAGAGLADDKRIGLSWWVEQEKSGRLPALQVALLLRQVWHGILSPEVKSVQAFAEQLRRRAHDDDTYTATTLRHAPKLLDELATAMEKPELASAIVWLVRAAQIESVGAALQTIDGGETYEDGLAASWKLFALDESAEPRAPLSDLAELFFEFDAAAP